MTIKMARLVISGWIVFMILSCAAAYPWHASCKIQWNFSADCSAIQNRILGVINNWQGKDNCQNGGERCLYKLVSSTDKEIKATHTTPVKGYVDDLIFTFSSKQKNGCAMQGSSRSEKWYAVLDYGTNYCNLHNLITGADLNKDPEYKETTDDSICTQYSSANCDKY